VTVQTAPTAVRISSRMGGTESDAPVVILFHGRGGTERDMASVARLLPGSAEYYAVRAPIAEGGGYAWFANRGIGRPTAESLGESMRWFRDWLDATFQPNRPVLLVGFSGGAAFAGGLLLDDPKRFAGAALLFGTLPFGTDISTDPAQLFGVPVFLAHGKQDGVIPADLQSATWAYLLGESGAPVSAHREPGGHELTSQTVKLVAQWLSERIGFMSTAPRSLNNSKWDLPDGALPKRSGSRPDVSWAIPQQQLTQNSPPEVQEQLFKRVSRFPNVQGGPSLISVPGARGFMLPRALANGPCNAFIVPAVGEFAHLHPQHDGSLHLTLPEHLAADAVKQGWAVPHPLAGLRLSLGMTMIFGPRDETELDIVTAIVLASYQFAKQPA
jgi:phospholipase/carboxylesterase